MGKVVGVYFSAHWCPPCRMFTPVLKDFYEEICDDGFEVVFASFDHSEEEQMNYIRSEHGDWYYVPFGHPSIREAANKLDANGIPALIIFKKNGEIVTKNGRSDVSVWSFIYCFAYWYSSELRSL
ncbi:unnamed protein product [Enterobius vermicularis]|uniref:protein-disulfide reductase n=1 Tax=Enterobius vermicularis TaxID=51028 RepID=A0A0N4VB99_ENTVE|nr:unnamed protein product [Enterobius vermicularis]